MNLLDERDSVSLEFLGMIAIRVVTFFSVWSFCALEHINRGVEFSCTVSVMGELTE